MRVGIIAANNIRYSPYIFFYTEILKKVGVEYELVIADRYGLEEPFNSPVHVLPWSNGRHPLFNYFTYAKSVKQILKRKRYDKIIVLTSINAVFLSSFLKRNYFKKYIVDIRDYSHENIYPYYILEKRALVNSLLNVVSSKKFVSFLPNAEYHVCHNYDEKAIVTSSHLQAKNNRIAIGYVGGLSYVDQCKKLMKLVASDSRFVFDFYGTSDKEKILIEIAKEFHCDRIVFHGAYSPSEKKTILQNIDIIFNAYGNGCPLLDCALSNKLYDAMIYKKPILTSPNTYMDEMAGPLSFPIDLSNEKSLNRLYNWYLRLDANNVDEYVNTRMASIVKENEETKKIIAQCILG